MDRFDLLIIQPTAFCNLNCSYCYLPNRRDRHLMPIGTIERVLSQCLASARCSRNLSIIYHAGEPLVAGVPFFQKAYDLASKLRPPDISITHYVQTNGTLINENWCEFFKATGFRVGVSLDGPRHIHDLHRRTWAERGSFDQVMRGVELLKSNGIPFSIISVITKDTLSDARAFHDFFVSNRILRVGINIDEIENANRSSSLAGLDISNYEAFLRELSRLAAGSGLSLRELEHARNTLYSQLKTGAGPRVTPLYSISFAANGDFTAFAPELLGAKSDLYQDFRLGNIHATSLDEALQGKKYARIASDFNAGVARCKAECEYFEVCGGGSASNKYFENGTLDSTETLNCRFQVKALFNVILDEARQKISIECNE